MAESCAKTKIGFKNIVIKEPPFHSFVLEVRNEVVLKNGGDYHHHVIFVFHGCSVQRIYHLSVSRYSYDL